MGYLPETIFLVLLTTSPIVACETNQIDLVREGREQRRARVAFTEALNLFAATPESPTAYAEFARRADELRPSLSSELASTIELRLAFLAMGPLRKGLKLSPSQQVTALATTVWSIALRVPVSEGESSNDYVERLCLDDGRLDCKRVGLESLASVIGAKVFRVIRDRAEFAYAKCRDCQKDPTYRRTLTDFRTLVVEVSATASHAISEAERNNRREANE
tara:strand:+ start:99955 stop:100611 length:657 start_codon:yes stop_codon:yes gene_type:complete